MTAPISEPTRTFAVIAGGGTSGHVLPALAVAEGLVARGHDPATIRYVGARRGIETRLLPETPFPFDVFDVVGVQRRLDAKALRTNAAFAPKLLRATRAATKLLKTTRPRVVVSVGGYASLPAVLAARRLKIPIVVVSFDRLPGRASRTAARHAVACAVAFENSSLPNAVYTGAPVRQAVLDVDRVAHRGAARAALGLADDRFVVAVMGGSQGSGVVNTAIGALVDAHRDDARLAIRHALGERFLGTARPASDDPEGLVYQPIGYEAAMPTVYAACDLLVGRGGASTAHEVAVTGTPAILVPWAGSADGHQALNVAWLADAGAAIALPESQIDTLPAVIARLRADHGQLAELSAAARAMGVQHRSGALAGLVESVALA